MLGPYQPTCPQDTSRKRRPRLTPCQQHIVCTQVGHQQRRTIPASRACIMAAQPELMSPRSTSSTRSAPSWMLSRQHIAHKLIGQRQRSTTLGGKANMWAVRQTQKNLRRRARTPQRRRRPSWNWRSLLDTHCTAHPPQSSSRRRTRCTRQRWRTTSNRARRAYMRTRLGCC